MATTPLSSAPTSGNDEVRSFDPNGADIDVLNYLDVAANRLWFHRSANDLVLTIIGENVQTTVKDWYLTANASERANFKIDLTTAGNRVTYIINAEALVNLMTGYGRPSDPIAFDLLHATGAFEEAWRAAWRFNSPPVVSNISSQVVNEDGTFTITINVTDEYTAQAGLTVTAVASDLNIVNAPTLSAPNGAGDRTLTVTTKPNASGPVTITIQATDGGGAVTERIFQLTVSPVADAPTVTQAVSLAPSSPATKPTLALGSLGIDIQTALSDTDGSETLNTVQISGVPAGLSFNQGTNLGSGVWSFTAAQLSGLRIQGPTTWSQNVQLSVTATSRETVSGAISSSSTVRNLNIDFNAAPTDIQPGTLNVNENVGVGTTVGTFSRTDADANEGGGDTATYSLVSNPGSLFSISSGGTLTTNAVFNREAASSYGITVRVTDSGGLYYDEAFSVSINDVNEAPSLNSSYSYTVPESAWIGYAFGPITASDPDANTPSFRDLRYELVGAPSTFAINSTNGTLSVQSNGLFGLAERLQLQRARVGWRRDWRRQRGFVLGLHHGAGCRPRTDDQHTVLLRWGDVRRSRRISRHDLRQRPGRLARVSTARRRRQ